MESIFEHEVEITFEQYREWFKHPLGKAAVKKYSVRLAFGIVVVIMGVFTVIPAYGKNFIDMVLGVFYLVFGSYFLFIHYNFIARKQFDLIIKSKDNLPWIRKTTFYEDQFVVTEDNTTTSMEYSKIYKITENEKYFIIWKNDELVFRFLKSGFTNGTFANFKIFIYNKYGKQQ